MRERRELGEQFRVARDNIVTELRVEEANGLVETFGGGSRRSRGECGGGK